MEQKLNQLVANRQFQYNAVLRRYKIIPESTPLATIRKGIAERGVLFSSAMIDALNDGSYSNYDENLVGPPTMEDSGIFIDPATTGTNGEKFWDFLNNFSTAAINIGGAVKTLRAGFTGEQSTEQMQIQLQKDQAAASQTKILTYGALAAVAIIVIILLVKRH